MSLANIPVRAVNGLKTQILEDYGTATLAAGTVTVTLPFVGAVGDAVFLQGIGTTNAGFLSYAITNAAAANAAIVITSSNNSDARVVNWMLVSVAN